MTDVYWMPAFAGMTILRHDLAAARLRLGSLRGPCLVERKRRPRRGAAGEDPVMGREVADEIEEGRKARVCQHAPGIAAYGKHLAAFDEVMPVELEGLLLLGHAAAINQRLAVILACRLQVIEFEQPIGGREEPRLAELLAHRLVLDLDRPAGDEPGIEEPRLLRHR